MSNYPDDIRNYDYDPRSPFYEEPVCGYCGKPLEFDVDTEELVCENSICSLNEENDNGEV